MTKLNFFLLLIALLFSCDSKTENPSGPYFPEVKKIIQSDCINCHSQSGTGIPKGLPVLLETDDQIASQADRIKSAVIDPPTISNKRMPYSGELNQTEKDIILKWFQKGGKVTD
jgi:uncharacterized membrane protein